MSKKHEIEAIATEAVQKSGLSGVSFRTLADAAGIKSSSVHYYFPAKSDLSQSLIAAYTHSFQGLLRNISDNRHTLREKLTALADIFQSVVDNDKFCLCGMMAAENSSLDEKSRELLNRYFHLSEQWIEEQLTEHAQELKLDMKPEIISKLCFASLQGAILIDRVGDSRGHLDSVRALFDEISKE